MSPDYEFIPQQGNPNIPQLSDAHITPLGDGNGHDASFMIGRKCDEHFIFRSIVGAPSLMAATEGFARSDGHTVLRANKIKSFKHNSQGMALVQIL